MHLCRGPGTKQEQDYKGGEGCQISEEGGRERLAGTQGQLLRESTYVRYTEESRSCTQEGEGGGWGEGQRESYSLTNNFCFG